MVEGVRKIIDSGNIASLSALARGDMTNARVAATPGGIEAQEKAGQTALVNSTDIPKEMWPSREAFEKIGFKFGADVDELFVSASLPAGWSRKATDHSMHSEIVDEQGRKRVSVFYKAAFYDRRADCHLVRRYTVETRYPDLPGGDGLAEGEVAIVVCDAGNEIHRMPATKRNSYGENDALRKAASEWLIVKFPGAADPTACW